MSKIQKTDQENIIIDFKTIATFNYIDNLIISIASNEGIENIKECSINEFKYLLQAAGSVLFPKKSKLLKIENNIFLNGFNIYSNSNMLDIYKIQILSEIYITLSHKYNKLIHIGYFSYLINMNISNIYTFLNTPYNIDDNKINDNYISLYNCKQLNNIRLCILKSLQNERENNIREKAYNGGGVGLIALANNELKWNSTGNSSDNNNNNILSVQDLPQLTTENKTE